MTKEIFKELEERIREYCRENPNQRILFTGFTNLYNSLDQDSISRRGLTSMTNKILDNLVSEGVLTEADIYPDLPYGMYKILEREN